MKPKIYKLSYGSLFWLIYLPLWRYLSDTCCSDVKFTKFKFSVIFLYQKYFILLYTFCCEYYLSIKVDSFFCLNIYFNYIFLESDSKNLITICLSMKSRGKESMSKNEWEIINLNLVENRMKKVWIDIIPSVSFCLELKRCLKWKCE